MITEKITLNNGVEMPLFGLGTYKSTDREACIASVRDALEIGYRMIDTASIYGNEAFIGEALRECSVAREDLFLVSKVWMTSYEDSRASVLQSMLDLGTDYLDLVLLHWPFGNVYKAWRDLEAMYAEGRIRAIGISNFYADRMLDLLHWNEVVPAVNQVEINLFSQQKENRHWMKEFGVTPMSYAPFGQGRDETMFAEPALLAAASAHGKTTRQVILRFLHQSGIIIIPKSVHRERIAENADISDFVLTPGEMDALAALDLDRPLIGNSETPSRVIRFWN